MWKALALGALLMSVDLITTAMAGIGREGNPLGWWLWMRYGFGALIAVKLVTIAVFVGVWKLYGKLYKGKEQRAWQLAAAYSLNIPYIFIVGWNLFCLLGRKG